MNAGTQVTSRDKEKVHLGCVVEGVIRGDLDLLRGPDGIQTGGDEVDLDVEPVGLFTKDSHRAHNVKKVGIVKDQGTQLQLA